MRAATNLYDNMNAAIQLSEANLENSMNQLSSGKRVSNPSDDPSAFSQNLQSLASAANVDRYTKNANAVLMQSQMADSALSTVVASLTSAISLATQAGNSSVTADQRSALAQQVQGILASVISQANTTVAGVPLFGGTADISQAFVQDSSNPSTYVYAGNAGVNQAAAGDALNVPVNIPGDQIFQSSDGNVLGSLQQTISALETGDAADLANASASLSSAIAHIGEVRATYAGTVNQLNAQTAYLAEDKVTLTSQQQTLVNADVATSATTLTQAQVAHSAVLAVAAKILPESLLNYLH